MSKFKEKPFDVIADQLGYKGTRVATLDYIGVSLNSTVICAPVSTEAVNLIKAALTKLKRIELSNFEFVGEIEAILREYDELTANQ